MNIKFDLGQHGLKKHRSDESMGLVQRFWSCFPTSFPSGLLAASLVVFISFILPTKSFADLPPTDLADLGFELDLATDFPDLLGPEDVEYFFNINDMGGLHWALSNIFARRSARWVTPISQVPSHKMHKNLPEQIVSRGGGSSYTSAYKMEMDLEQARFLLEHANPPLDPDQRTFLQKKVIPSFEKMLGRIPTLDKLNRTKGLYPFTKEDYEDLGINKLYNRKYLWRSYDVMRSENSSRDVSPLLNRTTFNSPLIESSWFYERGQSDNQKEEVVQGNKKMSMKSKGIVVLDDVLTPEAFAKIRQLLLEQTVWFQTKLPLEVGGYAGAYLDDGLHDKLLLQLAWEIHAALPPSIVKGHPLRYLWAYKYDSSIKQGIRTHADEAAVNVNIWFTPDDANLNFAPNENLDDARGCQDDGGLVVFTEKPPADWNFEEFNTNTDHNERVRNLLRSSNYANVTVPYRANRAVIFDSALFHHTDTFSFKPGYTNRRINLTILYGHMRKRSLHSTQPASEGHHDFGEL